MSIKRESNYDLLRIISAIAVIVDHVSLIYVKDFAYDDHLSSVNYHAFVSCLYYSLSRFAVPCFVMLSGAFILDNEKNSDYGYFYKKSFKNLGIPTIIFSVLYFLFSIAICIARIYVQKESMEILLDPVKNLIKGKPYGHMWYLYMLIGVYILVPVIIRLKNDVGEKRFKTVSYVFLVLANISLFTSNHELNWDLGLSFCYCGYIMAGYSIRKYSNVNNLAGICKIFLGGFILTASALICYKQAYNSVIDDNMTQSALIAIASILIFSGFSNLKINRDFGKLSALTFLIYLFHNGILTCTWSICKSWKVTENSLIIIPVGTAIILLCSIVCSVIYKKLWAKIENKVYTALKL